MSAMKIAILGATRGMGRAVARALAERGDELFLLGRDPVDLERSADDLRVRGRMGAGEEAPARRAGTALCDLERPETFAPALDAAEAALGGLDAVIVTAGVFGTQEELEADPERATRSGRLHRLLEVDFTHTVLFCEEARERLIARSRDGGRGVLCVFSSVAGDRARKPVVFYGAAKAGLSYYLEGIDLRFGGDGLRVVTVKPGFVRTSMTEGLPEPPFAGEPEGVAKDVVKAIDQAARSAKGAGAIYAPAPWRWIMLIVRNLPRWVRRRVSF
jgi:NAD(P)-dependent dehydrogenase (short-subunit alcohol dehydrogenase family)